MTGQGASRNDMRSLIAKQVELAQARNRISERMMFGGLYDMRAWQWVPRKPLLTPFEKLAGRLIALWVLAHVVASVGGSK